MPSKRTSKNAGFTIMETLIVLSVAGLILLMVLQAIPALQRNSHNNRRKQDVQAILEAVSHYSLNNSGNMPGPPPSPPFLTYSKLSYYDTTVQYNPANPSGIGSGISVSIYGDWTGAPPTVAGVTDMDIVNVYNHEKCDPDPAAPGRATRSGAGFSDVVALYAIETSGGSAPQCQQL